MRKIMTSIGLAGLLGCGSAETSSVPEETPVEKTEQVFQPDCTISVEVQRAALFNDLPVYFENPTIELSAEERKEKREEKRKEARSTFATTVPDLVEDIVTGCDSFYGFHNFIHQGNSEVESIYNRAKNLAGCMDPTVNFDQELVAGIYKNVIWGIKDEHNSSYLEREIEVANAVAREAGIDVKPYATSLVKEAYESATVSVLVNHHDNAEEDIEFANKIAREAGIDIKPYATLAVEAAYENAIRHIKSDSNDLARDDVRVAKQIATEAQLPDQLQKLTALEATLQ